MFISLEVWGCYRIYELMRSIMLPEMVKGVANSFELCSYLYFQQNLDSGSIAEKELP